MNYDIVEPDEVIEASFSAADDDLNVVSIRIRASLDTAWVDLDHIDFIPSASLTSDLAAITPQAEQPGAWRFEYQPEEGRFRATPKFTEPPAVHSTWVFVLRGVRVAEPSDASESSDAAEIEIEERPSAGGTSPTVELRLRKVDPLLRIDYFRPVNAVLHDQIVPVITSSDEVALEWATTGAVEIELFGPDGPITPRDTDGRQLLPHRQDIRDNVHDLGSISTTSTYTLVARRPGVGQVTEQVTVVVSDVAEVDRLVIAGRVVADLDVSGTVTARSAHPADSGTERIEVDADLFVEGTTKTPQLEIRTEVSADLNVDGRLAVSTSLAGLPVDAPGSITVLGDLFIADELLFHTTSTGSGRADMEVNQIASPLVIDGPLSIGAWTMLPGSFVGEAPDEDAQP